MAKNDYNDESKSGRIRQSIKEKKIAKSPLV